MLVWETRGLACSEKSAQGRAVVTLVSLWTTKSSEFRVGQGRLLLGVVAVRVRGQGL